MNECADCLWADWGEWSRCSASCGGGTQSHRRSVAVERKGEGRACTGPGREEQDCNAERCGHAGEASCSPGAPLTVCLRIGRPGAAASPTARARKSAAAAWS